MKGPATELIHAGEAEDTPATPPTTPIYDDHVVFENAQEVVAYNEGARTSTSTRAQPTVIAAEQRPRSIAPRRRWCSRPARARPRRSCWREGRRRDRLRRGDLRRHAAPARRRAGALRRDAAVRVARAAGGPGVDHRRPHPHRLVRVADQSDAALRRRRQDRPGLHGARCSR